MAYTKMQLHDTIRKVCERCNLGPDAHSLMLRLCFNTRKLPIEYIFDDMKDMGREKGVLLFKKIRQAVGCTASSPDALAHFLVEKCEEDIIAAHKMSKFQSPLVLNDPIQPVEKGRGDNRLIDDDFDDEDLRFIPDRELIPKSIVKQDKTILKSIEVQMTGEDRITEIDEEICVLRAQQQERIEQINKKYEALMAPIRQTLEAVHKEPQNVAM